MSYQPAFSPPTMTSLVQAAKHRGMTVRKSDGEYRVGFPGRCNEGSAYYTSDPVDALATMIRMYEASVLATRPKV